MRLIVGNLDGSDDSISVELLVGGMVGVLAGIDSGLPAGLLVLPGVIVAVVGTGSGCTIGLLVCWVVGAFVAGSVTVVMMVYQHSVFSSKGSVDKRLVEEYDSFVGPATRGAIQSGTTWDKKNRNQKCPSFRYTRYS